ncbi:MAG TPA: hypothetical protein DCZ72_08445 [Armatimonadetes bacterium]|mgnify:CR=1 FL=1|nr:hypothetical protein [Armatimonadota bacterium]
MKRYSVLLLTLFAAALPLCAQGEWAAGTRLRGELSIDYALDGRGTPFLTMSPDGRWLAVEEAAELGETGPTVIWDLSSLERTLTLPAVHEFSPDGAWVVYQDEDVAVVHSLPGGGLVGRFPGTLADAAFSADSGYLLTYNDGELGLYAITNRPGEGATEFRALGDGRVYELPSGRQVGEIAADSWPERVLSHVRGRILISGDDETVSLYDLPTQRRLAVWRAGWGEFVGPRGEYVLLGSYQMIDEMTDELAYELRRVEDGRAIWGTSTITYEEANVRIDPEARWAVVTNLFNPDEEGLDGLETWVYDLATHEVVGQEAISAPRLTPDGNFLIDAVAPQGTPLYALPDLDFIDFMRGAEGWFTPDGATLLTFELGRVLVWEPATGVG